MQQHIEEEFEITPLFNFRVVEFKMGNPINGYRFWIEREIEKEINEYYKPWWLLKLAYLRRKSKKREWVIFSDPATSEINKGYETLLEANYVIERYMFNMTPIYHNFVSRK